MQKEYSWYKNGEWVFTVITYDGVVTNVMDYRNVSKAQMKANAAAAEGSIR